jgi:hypothetical protein
VNDKVYAFPAAGSHPVAAIVVGAAFNQNAEDMMKRAGVDTADTEKFIASLAYDFADAMLAARDAGSSPTSDLRSPTSVP